MDNMVNQIIEGFIQGVTEFLPISSSSHLIIVSDFKDFKNQNLQLDICLHIGSFLAVLTFFHKDIINFAKNKNLFFKIFLSSIPIIIVGYLLVEFELIDKLRNIELIGWTTIIFGIFLYLSDKCKLDKNIENNFNFKTALIIGLFQVLSLMPGVSRSGIGITIARFLNYKREDAAKISFLTSSFGTPFKRSLPFI